MSSSSRVSVFDSASPAYSKAFHTFLNHTNQKEQALKWLGDLVAALPRHRHAIDAGAGTGKLTTWLAAHFETVSAIEPNSSLAAVFRDNCPAATLISGDILSASPPSPADFILCSHVFYYIPIEKWRSNVLKLASWLAPGGVLAIAIQNPDSDCMRMVNHFVGRRINLQDLAGSIDARQAEQYEVGLDTVEASIRTADLRTACEVAEFILNVMPMSDPPAWGDLERYVAERFASPDGGYCFSCHQDFLRVFRR
ncbi:MAG TPA: class I SAM-dependent methyltransferase [Pirellulales bacterium]